MVLVLLRRLSKAIKKVRFLLSFNVHKWRHVASLIGSPSRSRHRLSFNDPPGLLDCSSDGSNYYDCETGSLPVSIRRTASDADDINKRAEIFISNFHRHIQMERQVSLQLRYINGLERTCSY